MRRLSGAVAALGVLVAGVAVPAAASGLTPSARAPHPVVARTASGNPDGHAAVPRAGRAVSFASAHNHHVIGHGTPKSCTSAAVVAAVARGGYLSFNCGPQPVTIAMKHTAKIVNTSHHVVLDGGGLVTLNGRGKHQILYQDTCDQKQTWTTSHCQDQKWPYLEVQNLTFTNGYAKHPQTADNLGGGGAIFDLGGRLKVVNTSFVDNRCFHVGPDLGGAAIRALEQFHNRPVYVTHDTFRGGRCSNGSALSSIGVSWIVLNSLMVGNRATGHGANPAPSGSPGGGSGGAIYTDGNDYSVTVKGTVIRHNHAREGGGGIFFVSDDRTGHLRIRHSTVTDDPSAGFFTAPYTSIYFLSGPHDLSIKHSTVS